MKIFLAQQNYHIGDFELNTQKILRAIESAKAADGELIVFSELAVCGYPPRDFLEFNDFLVQTERALEQIRAAADTIGVIVGAPSRNPNIAEGKDLFNSAYLFYEGETKGIVHKTLLPTYDIFDENRYFEPAWEWNVVEFKGRRLAITVCEDIWNVGDNPLYRNCPMDKLMEQQPHAMINISASPFSYLHREIRQAIVKRNVARYSLPMVYVNAVGSQTEVVFDGGSIAMDQYQNMALEMPYFKEGMESVTLRWEDETFYEGVHKRAVLVPTLTADRLEELNKFDPEHNIDQIHSALLMGIRDYFEKMGFQKAIVASSGGVDSALVLALACEALGAENVQSIGMPSEFSSGHSVSDADQLSANLGNPHLVLPIREIYDSYLNTLQPLFGDLPFSVAEENLQSRIRGALVMAGSNKFGSILLNTSNKSELATGYGTLYGDMAGGLSVIGDLYKTQVYALCRYINRNKEVIPQNILEKAPSAELSPGQKDSDSLPEYDLLDNVLYQYVERRQGPDELEAQGFEKALVARILGLVNRAEFKRAQFCPIIRVSTKAFGVGRRMPIVGKYLS
jgi:NAD+ synthase (glutamine-hydrolysing)